MIFKNIQYFGQPALAVCDANCGKAWGINLRPKVQLSADADDYEYLADGELGEAPADPGTYEGGQAKPTDPDERLNKWCVRECERCKMTHAGPRVLGEIELFDFSKRLRNMLEGQVTG
jgi:hypothetical protein